MKTLQLVCGILVGGLLASAAEPTATLVAPTEAAVPGSTIELRVMIFNAGAEIVQFSAPPTAQATLTGSAGSRVLAPLETAAAGAPVPVAAGSFHAFVYRLRLPENTPPGLLVVEATVSGLPPLRAALEVQPAPSSREERQPYRRLAGLKPAADGIERLFASRFGAHESIYFIYGADDPAAKFQFSFKYRLLTVSDGDERTLPKTIHAGYTQRSLWDIEAESSPFYDTSYMPELIFEALEPTRGDGAFTWLGYQIAYRHESNGRAGDVSRSFNTAYLRTGFTLGRLTGWHLIVAPEIFTYVGSRSNNPDIADYRGYGKLLVALGRDQSGPSLVYTGHVGRGWKRPTHQLDLTIPFKTSLLDLETYILVQYFDGYGESLLSYREKSEALRAGISFVR